MCVYGDMELQERGDIFEFITGPLNNNTDSEEAAEGGVKQYSNQIMDFLMGFSPKIEVPDT